MAQEPLRKRKRARAATAIARYRADYTFVAAEFARHADIWHSETRFVSSPSEKYLHPSYARIIGLGPQVTSLLLDSLTSRPDDWFHALRAITGANPVTADMAGRYQQMAAAWIAWGRAHGISRESDEAPEAHRAVP